MKNLPELKKLIERYDSITLDEIENAESGCVNFRGVANLITGFGSADDCTLCKSAYHICHNCAYGAPFDCIHGEHYETYDGIEQAETPEQLLKAFRNRANHLKWYFKSELETI